MQLIERIKRITLKKLMVFSKYGVNRGLNYFRRTELPFSAEFVTGVSNIIENLSANCDEKILYRSPLDFPEVEELQLYWGFYKNIFRMYRSSNPHDHYFDWADYYSLIIRDDRKVAHDLFEMWYVQRHQPKKILEIGCRTGRSLLCKSIFHYDIDNTLIFCVDPFVEQGSPGQLLKMLKSLGADPKGFVPFVGFSDKVIPEIKRAWPELKFDYILVDGSHEPDDAYNDLCMSIDLLKEGGVLVFDDIGPGVRHNLLPVWEKWKAEQSKVLITREYYLPYGFAAARKK